MYPEKETPTLFVYRCGSRHSFSKAKCEAKRINGKILDALVWDSIKNILLNPHQITKQLNTKKPNKRNDSEQQSITKSIQTLERQIKNLASRIADADDLQWQLIKSELSDKQKQKDLLLMRLAEITKTDTKAKVTDLLDRIALYKDFLDTDNLDLKRKILDAFNVRVFGDGKNIKLVADWHI
jgi:hypothetical protein